MLYPALIDTYGYSSRSLNKRRGEIFLIAEAGTGHQGDLDMAIAMIDACQAHGVAAVKFQHVIASEILHPSCGKIPLSSGEIDLFSYFKKIEERVDMVFWQRLMEYCREKNILFLSSFFGIKSFQNLQSLRVEAYKIASPEMNYHLLWQTLREEIQPVFFSSGVSLSDDLDYLMSYLAGIKFSLNRLVHLHCVTQYPAPPELYNLLYTHEFEKHYSVLTGISDHTGDPYLLPVVFTAFKGMLGLPAVIERHFTLSSISDNIDDPVAINELELINLMEILRKVYSYFFRITEFREEGKSERENTSSQKWAAAIIDGIRELGEGMEKEKRDIIMRIADKDIVAVLGDGQKRLTPSEERDYSTTNRSLLAIRDIPRGEMITRENTAYLRSEKNLIPGLNYRWEDKVIGLRVNRAVKNGDPIMEKDLS